MFLASHCSLSEQARTVQEAIGTVPVGLMRALRAAMQRFEILRSRLEEEEVRPFGKFKHCISHTFETQQRQSQKLDVDKSKP